MTNQVPHPRALGTTRPPIRGTGVVQGHDMGKQKKRKIVPAALHSEISEYASLLRALRATDTLDITAQLTRLDSARDDTDPAIEEETSPHESPTSSHVDCDGVSSIEEKGHPSALNTSRKSRNTWSRWPLLPEDLHIPEWTFEDEVHALARQALLSDLSSQNQPSASTSSESHRVDFNVPSEDQADALLPPSSVRILADVSSSHLEHILSALASYCPVTKSTQHRRHPIGWESVLNIVSTTGLVDDK
jgi:hypothetical protein